MMMVVPVVIAIVIMATCYIVVQVFLPLANGSAPPIHFRPFMRCGCVVAITQIVAKFLSVVMELFMAMFDSFFIMMHIL